MHERTLRGMILFQQSRHALAEAEFRAALAENPDDAQAHAYLALTYVELNRLFEANREAEAAIRSDPDDEFSHLAKGQVELKRGNLREAFAAVEEALRLNPQNAFSHGIRAAIRFEQRNWRDALRSAERGLALDPEQVNCSTVRTMALLQLGEKDRAAEQTADALRRDPDNDLSHTAAGWAALHSGKPDDALRHFRDALRLDATNDWAKAGMIEAMKARYWLYRQMLRYFIWMSRLSHTMQIIVLAALFFAPQFLQVLARAVPAIAPFTELIVLAILAFAVSTWIAVPLGNALLLFNRFARIALSRKEKWHSATTIVILVIGLGGVAWYSVQSRGYEMCGLFLAFNCIFLLPPVTALFFTTSFVGRILSLGIAIAIVYFASMGIMEWYQACGVKGDATIRWRLNRADGYLDSSRTFGIVGFIVANILIATRKPE
jgi:tetratricopeptide (TPR) repeat protein